MLLTRRELDAMGCATPGCTTPDHGDVVFRSRCHESEPMWVRYDHGNLIVTCSRCDAEVARILVAKRMR